MPKDITCQICGMVIYKWWNTFWQFRRNDKIEIVFGEAKKVVEYNGLRTEINTGYVYFHQKCIDKNEA